MKKILLILYIAIIFVPCNEKLIIKGKSLC